MQTFFTRSMQQLNDAGHLQKMLKYVLFILVLTVVVAYLTEIALNPWMLSDIEPKSIGGMMIYFLIFSSIYRIHLQLLRRFVAKSMRANSSTGKASEREIDPGKPVLTELQLETFNCGRVSPEAEHIREELIAINSAGIWKTWGALLIACAAYLIIPYLLAEPIPRHFVLFYSFLIVLGLAVHKRKFRAKGRQFVPFFGHFLMMPIAVAIRSVFHPFYARIIGLLFAGIMCVISFKLERTGIFWASVFHAGIVVSLWVYPRLRSYSGPNVKLLVLRVFSSSDQAEFIFDSVFRYWRLFGTHMTVDDEGYAKLRYEFWQLRTLWRFLGIHGFSIWIWYPPFYFLLIPIAYDWVDLYHRRPAANTDHIYQRVNRILAQPKPFGIFFRAIHLLSFVNRWKVLVPVFVEKADVILMDLRRYSKDKAGVYWENNYILDYKELDRIIFLIDEENDEEQIHGFIHECWAKLEEGSPNENLQHPVARIFVTGEKQGDDVQALMDALLAAGAPDRLQRKIV